LAGAETTAGALCAWGEAGLKGAGFVSCPKTMGAVRQERAPTKRLIRGIIVFIATTF